MSDCDTADLPDRNERLYIWVVLTASSAVLLGALCDEDAPSERSRHDNFTMAMAGLPMCIAVITTFFIYIHPNPRLSNNPTVEGYAIMSAFFCSMIGLFLSAGNDFMGEDSNGNIVMSINANVYYFTWATFFASFSLLSSFLKDAGIRLNHEMFDKSGRLPKWTGLHLSCAVVMVSSSSIFSDTDCGEKDRYCNLTILSISVGAITSFLTLVMIGVIFTNAEEGDKIKVEATISTIVAIIYASTVGLITSADSPGKFIGNLYYFTWLSFILSAPLAIECIVSRLLGVATPPTISPIHVEVGRDIDELDTPFIDEDRATE